MCTFVSRFIYNEYIRPYFLLHVVYAIMLVTSLSLEKELMYVI